LTCSIMRIPKNNMKLCFLIPILSIFFSTINIAHAACSMSVNNVSFGTYDVSGTAPLDSDTGKINISCTEDVNKATVTISRSATSNSFNPRKMKLATGTDFLNYNIYTTSARSTIWGDGTGGTSSVQVNRPQGKPNPWAQILIIYGRIPAGQNVSVGSYSDNLTVTLTP